MTIRGSQLLRSHLGGGGANLQQTYYSAEVDPGTTQPLRNNCERLKAVNYYREVMHPGHDRVHGSVSDN